MSPQQDSFWRRVDAAAHAFEDPDDRIRALTEDLLNADTDEDIVGFRDVLQACLAQATHRDLYAAGVLLTGRTFDDERFEAFRCLLILKGRAVFEAAVRNPDTLGDVPFTQQEKELDFAAEMLLFAPDFAFRERHGEDAEIEDQYPSATIEVAPIDFTYDKERLKQQFPRLWPMRRAMVEPKAMES